MTERVLVIDPGDRVGWARCEISEKLIVPETVVHGVTPLKDFAMALGKSANTYDVFAYETWRLRPDKAKAMVGNDFQPVQLIGIVRFLAWTHGTRLVSIGPNMKKTGRKVMPDFLRERLSFSSEEHDKDALDLLAYYWWEAYR